ncbi:MAG TPA: SIMPL domain-containing protein [Povalibacter sp.]
MNQKLLCAALLGAMLCGSAVAADNDEHPRIIAVSGQGEVQAEPDQAIVSLGVESRKPRLEDARAEVTKTVEAVLKLTRDLKIDQKYVRATRISVQPEYNWDTAAKERNLIGYFVSRQVEVDLRDLEKLGTLLEKATDLGVNQLGDPRLESSKRRDLEREALGKAVADAKLNAEAVAKAAGVKLGSARTISASSGFVPVPVTARMKTMAMASDAGAAQTYQSGQMTFNGNVQVEYDLIVGN